MTFFLKSEIKRLQSNNGGVSDILLLFKNTFSRDKWLFDVSLFYFKLLSILLYHFWGYDSYLSRIEEDLNNVSNKYHYQPDENNCMLSLFPLIISNLILSLN